MGGRKNDDGVGVAVLNGPGAIKAVHPGHFHVQDDDLGMQFIKQGQSGFAVVRLSRQLKSAGAFQDPAHDGAHTRVVVGDGKGHYGFAMRKSGEVPDAIKKSLTAAKKNLKSVHLTKGTIAHEVEGSWTSTKVILKPAPAGTGIIAGGAVRAVLELTGIKNVVSKVYGSRTALNVVRATDAALQSLKSYDKVMVLRGLKTEEEIKAMHPAPAPKAERAERAPRNFERRAPRAHEAKEPKGDK